MRLGVDHTPTSACRACECGLFASEEERGFELLVSANHQTDVLMLSF